MCWKQDGGSALSNQSPRVSVQEALLATVKLCMKIPYTLEAPLSGCHTDGRNEIGLRPLGTTAARLDVRSGTVPTSHTPRTTLPFLQTCKRAHPRPSPPLPPESPQYLKFYQGGVKRDPRLLTGDLACPSHPLDTLGREIRACGSLPLCLQTQGFQAPGWNK